MVVVISLEGAGRKTPGNRASPGRPSSERGRRAADRRTTRLDSGCGPGASRRSDQAARRELRPAAPPLAWSHSLEWRRGPRQEQSGWPANGGSRARASLLGRGARNNWRGLRALGVLPPADTFLLGACGVSTALIPLGPTREEPRRSTGVLRRRGGRRACRGSRLENR
ncbi:hypothetical protein NDU88_004601 [Pleurodeles waltl]|uniref:Uncharacterized protein n=1 Tax=Pleurodeles waltl TaxID=8319 RepID=A0AAV7NP12_PLEWA|nr:hypothetical protein NDU88_004601 [Pleurodeles waltl]